jgi:hypothetical protein
VDVVVGLAVALAGAPAAVVWLLAYRRYLDHLHRQNVALLAALDRGVDPVAVMHLATVAVPCAPAVLARRSRDEPAYAGPNTVR